MSGILEHLALHLLQNHKHNLKDVLVVMPTKRAGNFLKKQLIEKSTGPLWFPQLTTINELTAKVSGISLADSLTLSLELYTVYKKVFVNSAQSFDSFLDWCPTLLSDFGDIDSYLLDEERFFKDLSNYKEIEGYSMLADEVQLTDSQNNYRKFWLRLGELYREFFKILTDRKIGYAGFINRVASEQIDDFLSRMTTAKTYFIGFNALSASEQKIISAYESTQLGELWFDADKYYLDDPQNEAGSFIRTFVKRGLGKVIENQPGLQKKHISVQIAEANSATAQSEVVAAILKSIEPGQARDTAVVLCDESLLIPVLNKIPDEIETLNITMGLSLKESTLYDLVSRIFDMHEGWLRYGNQQFYYKDFLRVVEHSALASALGNLTSQTIANHVRKGNFLFLSATDIPALLNDEQQSSWSGLSFIFEPWPQSDCKEILSRILKLLSKLLSNSNTSSLNKIETECIFEAKKACKKLAVKLEESGAFEEITEMRTIKSILLRSLALCKLSFIGEPLSGLQIMGLLETRALNFKNIIVVSANEGIVPRQSFQDSFIPHDVRIHHKLPARREKDAVYAYHFYRLFQGCESAVFTYNSNKELDGSGEPSRFLSQLEYELPQVNKFVNISYSRGFGPLKKADSEKEVIKSADVISNIRKHLERGISASSINKFLECPLNWYYLYVLGLKDSEEVEEEISSATLGTIIHEVLEDLYRPYHLEKKLIKEADLELFLSVYPKLTEEKFQKHHNSQAYNFGANHLFYLTAKQMINRFLSEEKRQLSNNKELLILGLEESLSTSIPVSYGSDKIEVKVKGFADRIDEFEDRVRIIDYKTGNVEEKEIRLKEEISKDCIGGSPKLVQLLLYKWLYESAHPTVDVDSGIFTLVKPANKNLFVSVAKDKNWKENFMAFLQEVVADMLNPDITLKHTAEAKYCNWCE